MSAPLLSIVIPAFNEATRLPLSLEKIAAYLAGRAEPLHAEVIVVDDGSSDGTAAAASEAGARLGLELSVHVSPENRGKGNAVRVGALAARGAHVLVSDADFSTPLAEWEKLAATRAPVAIGSRALDETLVKAKQPFYRQAMGKLFNRLVQLLVVPGIRDTQCGFKLFSRDAARDVFTRAAIDRFAYDVEALLLARRLGYAIAEVPVLWFNSADSRVSLLGGAQAYLDLLRIRFRTARIPRRSDSP
jgi:dolichyl-phosphate beta-glucosyltransferase